MQTTNPLWTAYNNIHNEGGEGYNPHAKDVDVGDGEPLWSKLGSRAAKLLRIMNCTSDADPSYAKLESERAEVLAALVIAKQR